MNRKPHTLNTRGLIAAAVAMASGSALAEQAGRISFVTGEVKATSADGSVRTLARGDIISTGDKISTGGGRLQLRFTDGGFVSLQPNTVFGVDQYLYANKPPEEASVFFSLLQGGMRTITGAIGKVNKQSYKVRTPVATIGIRGTEYRARVDQKRLVVSVGSGFVNVANDSGQITGGAGQNIQALEGTAPGYTSDEPDINATGPEGEREQQVAEDSESERQQRQAEQLQADGNNEELANLLNPDGTPHPVPTYVDIPDSLPNGSGYSITTTGANGPVTISGLTATFDPVTGAITSLVQTSGQEETAPPLQIGAASITPVITGPTFRPGTLKFVNNARYGNIGFGEITDGIAETNDFSSILPSSVGANEFYTYMMAVPTPGYIGGKASYSLQGATLARVNRSSDSGKLDHFNLDLNLLTGRADVDMLVKMANTSAYGDITVTGSGVSLGPSSNSFSLGAGLSTTATGSFCASNSCSTAISGLFVGDGANQVAASYTISSYMHSGSIITGYAALGQTQHLEQKEGDNFSIIMPNGSEVLGASIILGNNGGLASFRGDDCGECDTSFDAGTLKYSNIGHSGSIYWGEYTNGAGTFYSGEGAVLNSHEFQAYVVGPAVTPTFSGTANYSLQAGNSTPARLNGGDAQGKLERFNLSINLGSALASVDMLVKMDSSTSSIGNISVTGSNLYLDLYNDGSSFFLGEGLSTTATGSFCGCGGCSTDISGFFSGDNGNQVGVSYYISGQSSTVTGVAALTQSGPPTPDPVEELKYSMLTMSYGEGFSPYTKAANIDASFNSDNTIAVLKDLDSCEGSSCNSFEPGTLKTNAVGHSDFLYWGTYTNGSAAISNISGLPNTLAFDRYTSYIMGATISSAAIDGKATATYTLLPGNSAATAHALDGSGASMSAQLDSFVFNINLFSGLADLAINFSNVGSLQETVTAGGTNINLPLLGHAFNTQGDRVDGYPGLLEITNGITVASSLMYQDSNSFCYSGCTAAVYGILAGDSSEIGASYHISGAGSIAGVAALGLATPASGDSSSPLKDSNDYGGYVIAATRGSNVILSNGNPYSDYTADASFDSETGVLNEAYLYNGEGSSTLLSKEEITPVENGTYRTLNWGRITGTGEQVTYNGQTGSLGSSGTPESIHYVVGSITDPNSWALLNSTRSEGGFAGYTATYSVVGKSSPTSSDGSSGTLDSATLTLHLGALPSLDVALKATVGSDVYKANGSASFAEPGATFSNGNLLTTVNDAACGGSGCSTSVHGFFSGSQAQQAGMVYDITDQRTSTKIISGAAALHIDTLTQSQPPAGI